MTVPPREGFSLRRLMFGAGLALVAVTVATRIAFVFVSTSIRRTLETSAEQLMLEQQIADQIVSSSYSQQAIAYRYLQDPDPATLAAFHERGTQAYEGVRRYLFRQMPLSARLEVEAIKEAHEHFEVTAERAFDLARNGESHAAHARAAVLALHADTLERAVKAFIDERADQRQALRSREELTLDRLQWVTAVVSLALASTAILLLNLLRARVMVPLQDLSGAASRLADDTEGARMPPQRYREFQSLADSFNTMADRIHMSRDEVGARNRELTFALDHLQRTQQQLVQHEKLSAMGEMLAGLAHELNNPLAGILGIAECLKADFGDSPDLQSRQLLESMIEPLVTESHRARDLVFNLLHFARRPAPQIEAVRLEETVNVALGLCRHAFVQAGKRIVVDVPARLFVTAQAQKLEHAIINIMNNALDAFGEGKGTRLLITATTAGEHVLVTFEDDGPGFRQPERVFEPFYTTKGIGKGTGLGLALVHQFVEEFGGVVTADNGPSGGARLMMRLRVAQAPAEPVSTAPPPTVIAPAVAVLPPHREPLQSRQRILIVDDEPALRTVQVRLLAALPVEAETASSGAEARRAIGMRDFDLVITDLRMPGEMSGVDLIAWLTRERPDVAERIMVVTGDVAVGADGHLLVGEDRILRKPFAREDYLDRVRRALDAAAHESLAA